MIGHICNMTKLVIWLVSFDVMLSMIYMTQFVNMIGHIRNMTKLVIWLVSFDVMLSMIYMTQFVNMIGHIRNMTKLVIWLVSFDVMLSMIYMTQFLSLPHVRSLSSIRLLCNCKNSTSFFIPNNIHEKTTQFWLVKINAVFR